MLTALIGFLVLFAIAFLGFPLGLTMLLVGFAGVGVIRGWEPACRRGQCASNARHGVRPRDDLCP